MSQIAYAFRRAECGAAVADVCRQLGVSNATFYTEALDRAIAEHGKPRSITVGRCTEFTSRVRQPR